jgi:predicted GNAT family acetyltransferase
MPTLTEARFQKAKLILDRYRDQLLETGKLDFAAFERELKDTWKLSYSALKPIVMALAKRDEYVALAARYMEEGTPGVAAEFKIPLARLYGIPHYDAKNRDEMKEKFWKRMLG